MAEPGVRGQWAAADRLCTVASLPTIKLRQVCPPWRVVWAVYSARHSPLNEQLNTHLYDALFAVTVNKREGREEASVSLSIILIFERGELVVESLSGIIAFWIIVASIWSNCVLFTKEKRNVLRLCNNWIDRILTRQLNFRLDRSQCCWWDTTAGEYSFARCYESLSYVE